MIPNILTIAGSDCSGGAGIQADIKSISANGGYAMSVITAITAQNTRGVTGVQLCPKDFIAAQIKAIRHDIRIDAIKIGMLGDAAITQTVAHGISDLDCPVVLDPVMVAKGGDRLLQQSAVSALRAVLAQVSVITPNLPEAADLLDCSEAKTVDNMREQAHALRALGPKAVLLKGGHLSGSESPDLLVTEAGETWLESTRIATKNTHGTGCTYASALATWLGAGLSLPEAAKRAKSYITSAITHADELSVGAGHGPVHHFYSLQGRQI
ncbi:bifunctional hydroxymethylpyrimidine kinase/phosphomethylpyrimidine kinase [Celeribacter sp. PS-C1]|uniref:bifunctional hydroxymethylpyrimidine kinase/phosphomethylpyrimidine kinase n=1 Tax=Celeribacter sp. PS-C1 TaxID=2820813 RepID=UPI001CA4E8F5|nr:bifunctional hydroxymethylpyrimidine kinase/phosphomethylpyrimidine kinase [Celeribacter sp. PS-C1]MBW6416350.1 bifunctional hydroxymethylpyrimidine kinase/phosphomethylpyrimidine kinase [Celeribacter sp. PS-C1]